MAIDLFLSEQFIPPEFPAHADLPLRFWSLGGVVDKIVITHAAALRAELSTLSQLRGIGIEHFPTLQIFDVPSFKVLLSFLSEVGTCLGERLPPFSIRGHTFRAEFTTNFAPMVL